MKCTPHVLKPGRLAQRHICTFCSDFKINVEKNIRTNNANTSFLTVYYQLLNKLCVNIYRENKNQLWIKLQKLDRTVPVLKWPQFSSNKNLFVSLKIDTKNIVRKSKSALF